MRAITRKAWVPLAIIAGLALAGCDDQRLLQMFDSKAKLSGNRVPVFPEGVPGVQQGVPPELVKGYQAQADQQAKTQSAAAEAERAAAEERKRVQAERAAARRAAQPRPQPAQAAQPRMQQ